MTDQPITVSILEDDPRYQAGLRSIVEGCEDFELRRFGSTISAGRGNLDDPVDVLLCDLELEDGLAFELIEQICRETATRVVVVTVFGDERSTIRAIEAGAAGYLLKDAEGADIEDSIRAILRGESPLSAAIAGHLLKRLRSPEPPLQDDLPRADAQLNLTPREIEVLEGLARGLRFKEVAVKLGCSYHTVAQHVRNIYEKLSVKSKSEAIFEATRSGIISIR